MIQEGKRREAIKYILSFTNLDKSENNPDLEPHIPDRPLAVMLGLPNPDNGGKTMVWNVRRQLKKGRINPLQKGKGCVYILTNPSMPDLKGTQHFRLFQLTNITHFTPIL